jgi:hypothetical protein
VVAAIKPKSVGDIESFVALIRAACEDNSVRSKLVPILAMAKGQRRSFLNGLLNDLVIERAPAELIEALACLTDDAVADRAYEVIVASHRGRAP